MPQVFKRCGRHDHRIVIGGGLGGGRFFVVHGDQVNVNLGRLLLLL